MADGRRAGGTGTGVLRVPGATLKPFQAICAHTDEFCGAHLDPEYAGLCAKMTAKLARKRPSPLHRGDPRIWAAGVIYTVGAINFLFDPSEHPYLTGDRLSGLIGVPKRTIAVKSKLIRDTLKLEPNDPEFCGRELLAHHPWAWVIEVDGILVDARQLPRELQHEAAKRGLIPDLALLADP